MQTKSVINLMYEEEINALIPQAEKEALERIAGRAKKSEKRPGVGKFPSGKPIPYSHCFFTEYFHKAMNRLAHEAGLRP